MAETGAERVFDRPVIILSAPRAGSTLLFETLADSEDFWTIGGESHGVFERIPEFNPLLGTCDSNALTAADSTPAIARQVRASFFSQLRNSQGERYSGRKGANDTRLRLLEKTPKNAVRVSLLNEIFPDALFIFLYRNPRENISSMIDAWYSGRFITYRNLPGRQTPWSLLLPPGWQKHHQSSVEQIAAFQWQAANNAILQELGRLERSRWTAVSYGQQVRETGDTVRRLCGFCEVSADRILARLASGAPGLSRYTLTAPSSDKWHKNARALSSVVPGLTDTLGFIRHMAPELPEAEFDLSVDPALAAMGPGPDTAAAEPQLLNRNARCHCGSGRRFKHCHGDPRRAGVIQ